MSNSDNKLSEFSYLNILVIVLGYFTQVDPLVSR